jgi:hypothetical protein
MKNKFQKMIEYINSIPNGEIFARRSIKVYLEIDINRDSMATIDTYRNMFTQAGYINKSKLRGDYVKIQNVPENMTWEKLYEEAYGYKRVK